MKLDFALLADSAAGPPGDGKLYIHGGGVTRITALIQPWHQPSLAIVLRFLTSRDEWGESVTIGLELADPDGAPIMPPTGLPVVVPGLATPDVEPIDGEQTSLQMVLNLNNVLFSRLGLFTFSVLLNEETVARLPLAVVSPEQAGTSPSL